MFIVSKPNVMYCICLSISPTELDKADMAFYDAISTKADFHQQCSKLQIKQREI